MRDIFVSLLLLGPLPYALRHPWVGMIIWVVVSLLNPHRYTYGFAYSFPFALAAAASIFVALFVTRDPRRPPSSGPAITLILMCGWICITTLLAFFPEASTEMLSRVLKIYLLTIVGMCVIVEELHIKAMAWATGMSIAIVTVKGGIFTVLSGGSSRVYGPPGSFIEDNNAFALAAVMVVPLLAFLAGQAPRRWLRLGLLAGIPLSIFSALGSHSRGALLAICAMLFFLVLKGKNKLLMVLAIVVATPVVIGFLPDEWFARMNTIETYDQDASALGRINAWHMAYNLALDRIQGGGFATANSYVFSLYAPNPEIYLAAHSIYFQVLGEHGFVGLGLFLALWVQVWFLASGAIRRVKGLADCEWIAQLARMVQVSLIGYAVGGAFLSLSYWDMPYYLAVLAVALERLARVRQRSAQSAAAPAGATPGFNPPPQGLEAG